MEVSESIIRKIQKAYALAQNAGTEAEAATAMSMVQDLMAKYNLDIATVENTPVAGGTKPVEEKREKSVINRSAMYKWQRELWGVIGDVNFCWIWVQNRKEHDYSKRDGTILRSRRVKRFTILGRESNVIAAKLMGEYICDTIERILPFPHVERLSRSAISWREGCADRLRMRLWEKFRELKASTPDGPSTALALRDVAKIEEEKNYDALYGEGAYKRQQESQQKWSEERKEAQLKEEQERIEVLKNETPQQRAKREKGEENQRIQADKRYARDQARWQRERRRESERKDWRAYTSGSKAGESINLDHQVGAGKSQDRLN